MDNNYDDMDKQVRFYSYKCKYYDTTARGLVQPYHAEYTTMMVLQPGIND